VDALLKAGVTRVVAACPDPFEPASGGLERLANNGVNAEVGLLQGEARAANLKWLTAVERGWPYVVAKAAMTLDGRIATPSGSSKWITGKKARTEAHRLRAECGAVLVGRATVEKDDPELTVRDVPVVNQPVRIVLDPNRKLPGSSRIFAGEPVTWRVVGHDPEAGELGAPLEGDRFDLNAVLRELFKRGLTSLMVEGGARTIGAFFDAGFVDRLELFVSPKVLGAGPAWIERGFEGSIGEADRYRFSKWRELDGDLWITAFPIVRPLDLG
jgi:diaminohydroxyphosphoribosylaminopyrimidine deaminase/5-amino-6-(5-phosphoribosylamino)uracil reductase